MSHELINQKKWKEYLQKNKLARLLLNKVPYILAYKSRNFGPNLAKILSVRLIRGSNIFGFKTDFYHLFVCLKTLLSFWRRIKNLNFGPFFEHFFSIRLIRGSTYMRVYTVIVLSLNFQTFYSTVFLLSFYFFLV